VLEGISDRRVHVGAVPGLAQAVKLANNFIVATTLAAASEAVAFGTSVGVSMDTMLDVINASSGRSAVTEDKFVKQIATGRYASGFANTLMAKNVRLYLADATRQAAPTEVGAVAAALWERFANQQPGADFTRVYPFLRGRDGFSDSSDPR
jgi:3-hydroxyisobutyrate dehydrogenase